MMKNILEVFLDEAIASRLKLVEEANAGSSLDDVYFSLYRDTEVAGDWYVLAASPGTYFLSNPDHVADLIEESFMVDAGEPLQARGKTDAIYSADDNHHYLLFGATTDSPSLTSK